jgi:hypothetical protein
MKPLASVVKAKYLKDYIIDLTFDDGIRSAVDFSGWLRGEIFEPLKKKSFFKKFFLDGSTVAWPNGADIAPETLYLVAKKEHNKKLGLTPQKRRRSA